MLDLHAKIRRVSAVHLDARLAQGLLQQPQEYGPLFLIERQGQHPLLCYVR